ncbi:MAG: 50S ribosomal protein L24 [Acidimicrobiia bacterium]|nr:50S ribosomal protein L24 [Acidimicrobiia bacterium]
MKIKKGDKVRVLAGKDRGKEGEVMFAFPEKNTVIVEGVNLAKKHQRPQGENQPGGIIDKDMPMHVSNVAMISPKDGKPTRVGYKFLEDGTKVRVCRRTGAEIDG